MQIFGLAIILSLIMCFGVLLMLILVEVVYKIYKRYSKENGKVRKWYSKDDKWYSEEYEEEENGIE